MSDENPMVEVVCAKCTMHFGIPKEFNDRRKEDGDSFVCPVGHGNVYGKDNYLTKNKELTQKNQELQEKVDQMTVEIRRLKCELMKDNQK